MPARNSKQWEQVPEKLKSGEYVDSRIYSDRGIFEEEINKIFKKVWTPFVMNPSCQTPTASEP